MNNFAEPVSQPATAAPLPLLEARDVHKIYTMGKRKLEVLRGVSLSVKPKAIFWRCAGHRAREKARCSICSADWICRIAAKFFLRKKISARFPIPR